MEGLSVLGFVFGMLGLVAFVRIEKLTKTLKQKGILEEDSQEECCEQMVGPWALDTICMWPSLSRAALKSRF